jgi:hypothetical protein
MTEINLQTDKDRLLKIRFALSAAGALLLMAVMNWIGKPLTGAHSPAGIISFEFAGSLDNATLMLAVWDMDARLRAAFSLGIDYLFMVAYPLAISLGCLIAGGVYRRRFAAFAGFAGFLAASQWVAAGLDAVENAALLLLLLGSALSSLPVVAFWCAAIKFTLVGLGLAYVLLAGLLRVIIRR